MGVRGNYVSGSPLYHTSPGLQIFNTTSISEKKGGTVGTFRLCVYIYRELHYHNRGIRTYYPD